jgi:hypothetical protein
MCHRFSSYFIIFHHISSYLTDSGLGATQSPTGFSQLPNAGGGVATRAGLPCRLGNQLADCSRGDPRDPEIQALATLSWPVLLLPAVASRRSAHPSPLLLTVFLPSPPTPPLLAPRARPTHRSPQGAGVLPDTWVATP